MKISYSPHIVTAKGVTRQSRANPLTIKRSVVYVYAADNSLSTSGRFMAIAMSDFAAPDG